MENKIIGLGLESSCDETSASVILNGNKILSNIISSQIDIHSEYFGVVPEIASRAHLELVNGVVDEALKEAGVTFKDLSYVACTNRPGLVGSLLITLQSAKCISYLNNLPLITLSHIEAHLHAVFLMAQIPSYPFIGLLVSGGNTALYKIDDVDSLTLIGRTTDDAIGEAYDKISKYLGLGYPGGPIIDKLAKEAKIKEYLFPRNIQTKDDPFKFSYSGLKTSVVNFVKKFPQHSIPEIAWAFQESAIDILLKRLVAACEKFDIYDVAVAGGVAANSRLRERLIELGEKYKICIPSPILCTDNAAMVGALGYHYFLRGDFASLEAEVFPKDAALRV